MFLLKCIYQLIGPVILTLFCVSCLHLDEGPLSAENEKNDIDSFFGPGNDFYLFAGDPKPKTLTLDDLKNRSGQVIPKERQRQVQKITLPEELLTLEENLTDQEFKHYEKHKNKLKGVSEKIYFLKLNGIRQRDQYLWEKGFRNDFAQASPKELNAIYQREITLGMSKKAVRDSWGQPVKIEIAGNPRYENERWSFYEYGKLKYVFFENGRVEGWDID